jgi:hypothetical protein
MKEPPAGFQTACLLAVLESNWALGIRHLDYLAVGFGAHHWRATAADRGDVFVSVHDLDLMGRFGGDRGANFELLAQAIGTARWLESVAGLEFVLGPLPDNAGSVVRIGAERFAGHVYPWTDCETLADPDGSATAHLIGLLHRVTDRLPANLTRLEDFEIPHRAALASALAELAIPWDTVLIALRERDLWELPNTDLARRAYQVVEDVRIEPDRLRLYEAWYALSELAVYLAVFRAPHEADRNSALSWENYLRYLPTC